MKLSIEQGAKAIKAYEVYFDSYINGDVDTISSMLDENYNQIGSAEAEVFYNKNEAIKFLKDTIHQVAGKTEIRNRSIKVDPIDKFVLVTDLFDIYALMETEWAFYAKFRASTLMEQKEDGWKFIHQHSSMPDSRTEDGENIAIEKIAAENQELREAVKRCTIELENKSKELEIEASLERVRTVAMSMQKPDELLNVCQIISEQLEMLNVSNIRNTQVAIIDVANKNYLNYQYFSPYTKQVFEVTAYEKNPASQAMVTEMQKSANSFFIGSIQDKDLEEFREWRKKYDQFPDPVLDKSLAVYYYFYSIGNGGLGLTTYKAISDTDLDIFKRFHKVFELAYRRFHDIEKAEAQAKEAKIEAALERVRSRSMAMHNSEELREVIQVIFDQLGLLNINAEHAGIVVDYQPKKNWHFWIAETQDIPSKVTVPYLDLVWDRQFTETKKKGKDFFTSQLNFEEKNSFYEELLPHIQGLTKKAKNFYLKCAGLAISTVIQKDIGLYIENFSGIPYTVAENSILMRFGKVFQQTYTRFLDLQKAEGQAREAQIEGALERVRSRSMAMHKSEELAELSLELVKQVQALGVATWFCAFNIYDDDPKGSLEWGSNGQGTFRKYRTPREGIFLRYYEAGQRGETLLINEIDENECPSHYDYLCSLPGVGEQLLKMKDAGIPFPSSQIDHAAFFKYGYILFITFEPAPEAHDIFKRFAKVFEQTYTRFLDLKKAEEQTREAQVDAALERTRNHSMRMQHSDQIKDLSKIFHEQLISLNIPSEFSYIWLPEEKNEEHMFWATWSETKKGKTITNSKSVIYPLDKTEPYTAACFEAWESDVPVHVTKIPPEEIAHFFATWADMIKGARNLKARNFPEGIYYAESYMNYGCFGINIRRTLDEEEQKILLRFTIEFERAYTRFLDLQKAEAQAREAQVEAALERVRARALAMQQPEELKDVANVLRKEMGLLGVEELETCSIYINDEKLNHAECWYAIKDVRESGKTLVNDYFTLNLNDTWIGRKMSKFYQSKDQQVSIIMNGKARIEWIRYCEEKSVPLRGYYGDVIPDRTYHLYKFSHGAVGVATPGDISEENWNLVKRVATVFSLAYSRFRDLTQARIDLQRLKEEKQRAEDALTDLKSTQEQLVHAEKMASLGELTAGIAHEIQNPLNFVNNFSEVNSELIEELIKELGKGELEEVNAIAMDISTNEEKIKHHGKRADDIVKGMLQHSRTSATEKEPTDINLLADEYLRLAYHGLRAKDKSFNADFKTELDESLEKIKVLPQDMGRVLLNLINNAFYAVSERVKLNEKGYKPIVLVITKNLKGIVDIRVKDNGNGIPEKVKQKIFHPFFTTKPTGEGTGLGLSLSYDIITKGHGGEMKVETTVGEGSEFIIQLPV